MQAILVELGPLTIHAYGALMVLAGLAAWLVARRVLDELGVPWREVRDDSPDGLALAAGAPPLRPVLYRPDGRLLAYGRLSARRLHRDLARAARALQDA